ncbi:hypothetical protein TNCV_4034671 [Trichonephila clavipes]|nr:hypothetical protein TNCV_4034671 [Trichonephila clavipes]
MMDNLRSCDTLLKDDAYKASMIRPTLSFFHGYVHQDATRKTTRPHSRIQMCRWTHHSLRTFLCCSVNRIRKNNHYVDSSGCSKRHHAVCVDAYCAENEFTF